MNKQSLTKLELNKVLDKLSRHCATNFGKEQALRIMPVSDEKLVAVRMAESSEARQVLRVKGLPPFGGIKDIRQSLQRSDKGALLLSSELLDISEFLRGSKRLQQFCLQVEADIPQIKEHARLITIIPTLQRVLEKSITDEGEVDDRASEKLYSLRQKIKSLQVRVKEKLNSIIRSTETQKLLQDPIVTIRSGRYVVPVKQEYRSRFPGLVHDQSASGATLFIEPMAVVEMNNELRQQEAAEKKEVEAILRRLTDQVRAYLPELVSSTEAAARLDVIFAKGRLSEVMDAGAPTINHRGNVNLVSARHPLIEGHVVPISVYLGKDFHTLLITGPNTGGKTVTLKTVGLLVLMAQCGLHLPAEEGTEVSVFKKIFADIGDEQSIEQSLSTFSSHMTNIINIVQQVDSQTLVLLDEVGAGTDPTEGAALAMGILEYLHKYGATTIATTHYSELKAYAYSTEGIENASVEFDVATLRPTYRLMIGVPGGSNAFEVASRLGLPSEIVDRSREFLSSEQVKVSDLIQSLEENQRISTHEREKAESLRDQLAAERRRLEEEGIKLENKQAETLRKAHVEAENIVREARREAEHLISEMRQQFTKQLDKSHMEAAETAKTKLFEKEKILEKDQKKYQTKLPGKAPQSFKPGMEVFIPSLNQKGYLLEAVDGQDEVLIQAGIMKIKVKKAELRPVKETINQETKQTGVGKLVSAKTSTISPELDLRGVTVEEALDQTGKYLDDAVLAGLNQVRIIHGKGTGALRRAVRELLGSHPQVNDFFLADIRQGGSGATEVKLG